MNDEFFFRDELKDKREADEVYDILSDCDKDFEPPLSERGSTIQKTWEKNPGDGVRDYFHEVVKQHTLLLKREGKIIAFLSFRPMEECEELNRYRDICYFTTLCIRKEYRGQGLALMLYQKAEEYVEKSSRYTVMALRTWSTNKAQLHLMDKLGFHCETRLKNDRGEGVDTIYFVKEITGTGIRAYGYTIGNGKCGARNTITDVPGVKVGHYTVCEGKNQTGVTVIIPCDGVVYEKKPLAAVYALNGFGKTQGTVQIEELGVLETPIALTNTLNVGKVADGLVTFTERECRKNGKELVSVNPVVGETNDSKINQITERVIEADDVLSAIEHAGKDFKQGAAGAGRGTVCFGLKGGIGSASRVLMFGGTEYTIGVLVQSNFGKTEDLTVAGISVGRKICAKIQNSTKEDKGSIMVIVGTDLPLGERQLKRVLKRVAVGLVRTGSYMGHGSGDVFIGFTNANSMPDMEGEQFPVIKCFPENQLDKVFRLVAEAVEESILNSLTCAKTMPGRDGEIYHSLCEFL